MTYWRDGNRGHIRPTKLDWDASDLSTVPSTASRGWVAAGTLAAAVLLLLIGFMAGQAIGADAMATCQQSHSFDTCFLSLER